MRMARMDRPQSRLVSAATAVARAPSFADGAQASSRSRKTRSAPERAATSAMCSLLAGVASSLRRGRIRVGTGIWLLLGSDRARRAQRGETFGVEAEEI